MTPVILGIDPGMFGAVAALDQGGELIMVADLPIISDRSLKWVNGSELQSLILGALQGRGAAAIVERVSAMPKQGVASSFQFGVGFGSVLSVLQALHIRIEFVTPAVWKKSYGLSKDKNASLHRARLLFPGADLHLAKHDGRAEALLIARYSLNRAGDAGIVTAPPEAPKRTSVPLELKLLRTW
jgi:crossover junction endodeoxyribonuclease RuvC